MGRKKVYRNAAERQRAWRIRSGKQRVKVPVIMRIGEQLGTSEGQIRKRKEGETWKEYSMYLKTRLAKAEASSRHGQPVAQDSSSVDARRGGVEPVYPGDYYEMKREQVASYQEGKIKGGRKINDERK